MADWGGGITLVEDTFSNLARHYDAMMSHVDYDRWALIASHLRELAPKPRAHLDIGCGTGKLVTRLRRQKWQSTGIDISPAMVRTARSRDESLPLCVGDICRLPFHNCFDMVTCLFDTVNFLLERQHVEQAMQSVYAALRPGGLYYFDVVTERMILDHFEGQQWTEQNGKLKMRWYSRYNRKDKLSETQIAIGSGPPSVVYERIYSHEFIDSCLRDAGFVSLGAFDAANWKAPRKRTIRVDYVAVKPPSARAITGFDTIKRCVQAMFDEHTAET